MAHTIYFIFLIVLFVDFIIERILSQLNRQHAKLPIPALLSGIYDDHEYKKQQSYFIDNNRFGLLSSSLSFVVLFCAIVFGCFGWLDEQLRVISDNELVISLFFFGILFIVSDLLSLPFDIYDTFVIEERYGFNKTTPRTFISDRLKSYLLTMFLGGGILSAVIWIYQLIPDYFWILGWAIVSLVGALISFFYSELIVPLFNKQTPLEQGSLRDLIEEFGLKSGFNIKDIYVINGSKRSTKANAYFTGLGSKKRIVLYDTLISELSEDEIVAVLAHEIGHYKNKHTIKNLFISLISNLCLFYLLGVFIHSNALAQALGGTEASFHLNVLAFGLLYSPLSLALGLFMNSLSRKYEYQADNFVKENGIGSSLVAALKKISAQSLANLTPHPAFVFFHYSHPTLYQRIRQLSVQ